MIAALKGLLPVRLRMAGRRANLTPESRERWGFVDADTSLTADGFKP